MAQTKLCPANIPEMSGLWQDKRIFKRGSFFSMKILPLHNFDKYNKKGQING
jgi:hypothetical protein